MIINPIHKKGDKSNPENYRAIALLSIQGKVFNKILLERIKDQTEEAIKETRKRYNRCYICDQTINGNDKRA